MGVCAREVFLTSNGVYSITLLSLVHPQSPLPPTPVFPLALRSRDSMIAWDKSSVTAAIRGCRWWLSRRTAMVWTTSITARHRPTPLLWPKTGAATRATGLERRRENASAPRVGGLNSRPRGVGVASGRRNTAPRLRDGGVLGTLTPPSSKMGSILVSRA